MIYHIKETTSTNDEARKPELHEGDVVWADFQTAGRGQRGHKWLSRHGENVTFSLIFEPHFLPVPEQFAMLEVVTVSLTELFDSYGIDTRIKWTNDIYAGDDKMVGILIEHVYSGYNLSRTIAGIGINVNQREFDPSLPNPTSMSLQTGREYLREEVLERYVEIAMCNYALLKEGGRDRLHERYVERMYRLGERHPFALPDGTRFEGTITGAEPSGRLLVERSDGSVGGYLFKEIEFVIQKRDI